MFFMVRVSKPSLFLQVGHLPVPPCFDDCHDGLFLLCPSWPGSIMVTPWTLLVVPPWVVLSLWSLPWSFPRGSSLVFSLWFLLRWSFPCVPSLGPSLWFLLALVLFLSLFLSLYLMSHSALVVSDTPHMYIQ